LPWCLSCRRSIWQIGARFPVQGDEIVGESAGQSLDARLLQAPLDQAIRLRPQLTDAPVKERLIERF